MKIYIEPIDEINFIEEQFEHLLKSTPAELLGAIKPLVKIGNHFYFEKTMCSLEVEKYKLMWALRNIEKEIEAENGTFVIEKNGSLLMRDFSETLRQLIKEEIGKNLKK